jgi:hypothetical protein
METENSSGKSNSTVKRRGKKVPELEAWKLKKVKEVDPVN